MSDWSWKQAVAERVLQIVNDTTSVSFSINDLYAHTEEFVRFFPRNQHVREKLRQVLQKLRDDGFLSFHGGGRYAVNLAHPELDSEAALLRARGIESPVTQQVVQNVRLRSTLLGAELKRNYRSICQACRMPVPLWQDQSYAEAHHLWLSAPLTTGQMFLAISSFFVPIITLCSTEGLRPFCLMT